MKKFFTLFLTLMTSVMLWAYDFQSGDLYYYITSNVAPYTVGVTSGNTKYSGDITIPSSVTYNGITYTVTRIGIGAFNGCSSLTSVTIPNSVTSIGLSAFQNCSSLTSITIPNSVTSIESNAFKNTGIFNDNSKWENGVLYISNCLVDAKESLSGAYTIKNGTRIIAENTFSKCSSLTSITIPNSMTSIGHQVFRGCSSLTSVTIPNSVTSIGGSAFRHCSSLTSVTIPNSVTSIGGSAFEDCSSLTSVTIPNSVTSIGRYTFRNTGIFNDNSNWENGVLYISNCLVKAKTSLSGAYTIKNGTRIIGGEAFYGCSSLTSVTIPNSVKSIEIYAFSSCSSLTSVTIPNSVTSIGHEAFASCSSLTSVTIPNSVKSIESYAFSSCSSLTSVTIPNSVTSIGDGAFSSCSSLTSVTIPNSVTSIGSHVFSDCTNLRSLIIPKSATSIGADGYPLAVRVPNLMSIRVVEGNPVYDSRNNCNAIIETATDRLLLGCQSTVIPNDIKRIEKGAFLGSKMLTSIDIPASVDSIGYAAFANTGIIRIAIPAGTVIENTPYNHYSTNPYFGDLTATGVFSACRQLTEVVFPDGMTYIPNFVFSLCSSLQSVVIPNSVVIINMNAFSDCTSLESITIPENVENIGRSAFENCSALTDIYVKATTPPALDLLYDTNVFTSSPVCHIPCGTKAAYEASAWASQVKRFVEEPCEEYTITYTSTDGNIVTPNRTDAFGANIVSNTYENGVGTITFDGPITSIGSNAFQDCYSLTSVTIPESVTSIGESAISSCSSLTSVTIPNSVTSIGNEAFNSCSSLTSVTIPNSVTRIGSHAFYRCSDLTSVTIPNSVTSIGISAFGYCSSLTSVTIPNSVTSIGISAFSICSSLTSITIPSSVTSIGNRAFEGCSSLTSITIPNSVTSIGDHAFNGCSSLTSITIPNSVTSIGEGAFRGCSGLKSMVVESGNMVYDSRENCNAIIETATNTLIAGCQNTIIPNSVTSIGEWAFLKCTSLTSITIPNSVTSIGEAAFCWCSSLKAVTCEATTPPTLGGSLVFTSSPTCYIPCGTKAAYETSNWAQYVSEFVEDCDYGSYSRNVRIGYNTICLPHGSSHFTGATFYEIAHILKNKKKIFFDEVKTLEAGKPYIFYPHSNEVIVYYDNTTSAIPLSHNGLHGTFDGITAASNFLKGKYLVAGNRMVLCGDGCSLAANRAYIVLDEISDKDHPAIPGIKRVSMDYSEENATTALDNITDESIVAPIQEGVYDILGRKVNAPTVSGFYIINGKKVFIAL